MEPGGVTHLPEPVSPTNRSRVHKVEPTNRSHNVQYQPKPHTAVCAPFVIRSPNGGGLSSNAKAENPGEAWVSR